MTTVARILVPLDLHRWSEAKLPVVRAYAQAFDAQIILLHVRPPERPAGAAVSMSETQARTYLDAIATRMHGDGLNAHPLVRWGQAADTILNEIEEQHADLVILGSTVRPGLSRLWLGSVAAEVVANASCPVLLVRPPDGRGAAAPAVRSFAEDAARSGPVVPRPLGARTVEVARIIGSVGRAAELDARFRPQAHRRTDEQRFERVRALMQDGAALPPVDLYKLGYGYYVLDGHHRVAAALQVGQLDLDALVTEFMPLGDGQEQRVAAERRAFERATGVRRIGAVVLDHYPRLEEMIRTYAAEQRIDNLHDAALRWSGEVYRPVAEQIRRRRMAQRRPGERTADVFVRLAAWREEVARDEGRVPTWDEALASLPH